MQVNPTSVSQIELATQVSSARYACCSLSSKRDEFLYICGYEKCGPHYDLNRTTFPYLTLEMVVEGEGELTYKDDTQSVHPGTCFCFGPNMHYRLSSRNTNPLSKYFIAFGPSAKSTNPRFSMLYPGFTHSEANPSELFKWNELILEEGRSTSKSSTENVASLVDILLRKIIPLGKPDTIRHDALVLKALHEIDRHFQTISSIKQVAERLGVSAEHLCRVFKSNQKSSPYKILTTRKMEHAYAQLKLTTVPIQEIANSLGFTDAFHFSRSFKRFYGFPPREARIENRKYTVANR